MFRQEAKVWNLRRLASRSLRLVLPLPPGDTESAKRKGADDGFDETQKYDGRRLTRAEGRAATDDAVRRDAREAAAAAAAGIDILSIVEPLWSPAMREAAGDCFVQVGLIYGQRCTYEDYLRAAHAG